MITLFSVPLRPKRARAILLGCVAISFPSLAIAQEVVQQSPTVTSAQPVDPESAARQEAQRQLTASLGQIARNGNDASALSQAGRAALVLGDARAALGFLARAEALAPRDPVIKAALGATMVQLEDPAQAMRFFEAAIALGGLDRTYIVDRGLAFDLLGDQLRAQADYAAAAQFAPSAEVTRRHAISLGISGNVDAAVQMLGPLLRGQDRAAWRSRAMIVAMNGRADEARQIAAATMPPQLAGALGPYFGMMDRLTPPQAAAAAHFGRFPSYEVVSAQPQRGRPVRVAAVSAPAPATATGRQTRGTRDGRRVVASATPAPRGSARTAQRSRQERAVSVAPAPAARTQSPPVTASAVSQTSAIPAPLPMPAPAPVAQPVMRETLRQTIIQPTAVPPSIASVPTPTPAPASVAESPLALAPTNPASECVATPFPPAERPVSNVPTVVTQPSTATISAMPMGPPDGRIGPALPAAQANVRPAITEVALPASGPSASSQPATTGSDVSAVLPAPVAPAANTVVVEGWSLSSVVQSIAVPESERSASPDALTIDDLDRIAADRRRSAAAAATEARRRQREETQARETEEAAQLERAEREAAQRAEQEERRRHPARIWVQVATGADASALASDYRRFSQRNAEIFRGQSGGTASWNRTRRLVVGPFPNAAAARTWLNRYTAAGGQGFVWNSDHGEEVTPLNRR